MLFFFFFFFFFSHASRSTSLTLVWLRNIEILQHISTFLIGKMCSNYFMHPYGHYLNFYECMHVCSMHEEHVCCGLWDYLIMLMLRFMRFKINAQSQLGMIFLLEQLFHSTFESLLNFMCWGQWTMMIASWWQQEWMGSQWCWEWCWWCLCIHILA